MRSGGSVIADYGTAITDQHGAGYRKSPLDRLFGIDRSKNAGWFDGSRFEINGEHYARPFVERFAGNGVLRHNGLVVAERGLNQTRIENTTGQGKTLFINSSPTRYFDANERAGEFGKRWRQLIGSWLRRHQIEPSVEATQQDQRDYGVEVLRYRAKDNREIWAIVENPTRQASISDAGSGQSFGAVRTIRLNADETVLGFKDLRTGRRVGHDLQLPPGEALVLEVLRDAG